MIRWLIQFNQSVKKAFVPILLGFLSWRKKKLCQVTPGGYLYIKMQTQVRFVEKLAQQQNAIEKQINFSLECFVPLVRRYRKVENGQFTIAAGNYFWTIELKIFGNIWIHDMKSLQ